MKKNPSWERSKNASRRAGVLNCMDWSTPENNAVAGLRGSVHRAVVGVGPRMEDPHGVRAARGAHDDAVPENLRRNAGRLDAVRTGGIPGPGDPGPRRDRVDGRVLAAVLRAAEED